MRLHYLQHVAFEDAANIAAWAAARGHTLTHTRLDLDEPLPPHDAFDWLAVMGGPMNVDEHDRFPWLVREKQFLGEAIRRGTPVLGVCLGAQLVAEVLGGAVTRNPQKEIGWFPVTLTEAADDWGPLRAFPRQFLAFHWHGDQFSIPPQGVRLAGSAACDNQAFRYAGHVLGLQFHLDYSAESIEAMLRHCGDELIDGPSTQKPDQIRPLANRVAGIRGLLDRLLDAFFS